MPSQNEPKQHTNNGRETEKEDRRESTAAAPTPRNKICKFWPWRRIFVQVNLYVSDGLRRERQYGFLAPSTPMSLLPRDENWRYVRSGDTSEFGLPTIAEEQIRRNGFWARSRGEG